jgi:hypothetical protein
MSNFKRIKRHLKALKDDPRLGGVTPESMARFRAQIQEAIGEPEVPTPSLSVMYWEFFKSNTFQYLSKPVIAGAFSVVVIASGWLTTVRASDSLPGETLYSVKMITERAQLRLASLDRKAVLHTEFAGRRLQEASELRADQDTSNDDLVHGALEAYKQEVASAATNLRQLKDEGDEAVLATATSVQQNLQAIDTTIDQAAADSSTAQASQDAIEAKEAANVVSNVATDVVVEVHEEQPDDASAQEVKQMFKDKLGKIEARQRFDVARIQVIRQALVDKSLDFGDFTLPTSNQLSAYEYTITSADLELSRIMNMFAAGGYRNAFQGLQAIDTTLLEVEAELAQLEMVIMTAKAQVPAPQPDTTESNLETQTTTDSL